MRGMLEGKGASMLEASCSFLVNIEAPISQLKMGFCTPTGHLTHAAASHPPQDVTEETDNIPAIQTPQLRDVAMQDLSFSRQIRVTFYEFKKYSKMKILPDIRFKLKL